MLWNIYAYSQELLTLKAAEKQPWRLPLTVRSKLTVQPAGKHNVCGSEIGGCVSGYTYISRILGIYLLRWQTTLAQKMKPHDYAQLDTHTWQTC